jgi:anti-anti-sigma factor
MRDMGDDMVDFELRTRDLGGGVAVIEVSGELDLAVADRLRERIDLTAAEIVAIDLSDCRFIDSTGLAVIVRAQQDFGAAGRRLSAVSPSRQVMRLLEVTGLAADGFVVDGLDGLREREA